MTHIENLPAEMTAEEKKELYENWSEENRIILIERNMRFAIKQIRRFKNTRIEKDELVGIAFLGLVKAAKAFRPEMGEFTAFAGNVINNEVLQVLKKNRIHPYPTLSLDNMVIVNRTDGDMTYADLIPDKREDYDRYIELKCDMEMYLDRAGERNKRIVIMYLNGMKQKDIGKRIQLDQSTVCYVIKVFRKQMKKAYGY